MQRPTWLPTYLPELDGLRGLAILAVVLYHCHPRLEGTWLYYASLWGWAGVILFFTLSGFLITCILLGTRDKPHYFHQFSCAPGAARLARVFAGAGRCLPERAVVRWRQRMACDQDCAMAGLHFLRAEPVSPHLAAGARTLVGAGNRRAVLLCVGAGGALAAAGRGCWRSVLVAALVASPMIASRKSPLDDADEHADSSGRDRAGQFAGACVLHSQAQPARMAGNRPRRICAGNCGGGHHRRRNLAS